MLCVYLLPVSVTVCDKFISLSIKPVETVHLIAGDHGQGLTLTLASFPPPVVGCLQYVNTEGEGLGDQVMCGCVR